MTTPMLARTLQTLPLSSLDPPALDARLDRDEAQLEELGRDIQTRGLVYPLHVFVTGARFEIVDGQCRALAATRVGLVGLECFVYPSKHEALEGVKYAANAFRQAMSPADEARFFWELYSGPCEHDLTRVALRCGKSLTYVQNRIELLQGDDDVFLAVRAKEISLGVAAALNKFADDGWRRYFLTHAIRSGATVAMVEGWLQQWTATHGGPVAPAEAPAAPTVIVPGPSYDPHRCEICGKNDPRFIPEQLSVHTHCKHAILEPMLAAYHGQA